MYSPISFPEPDTPCVFKTPVKATPGKPLLKNYR